jgi:hypothetical protein
MPFATGAVVVPTVKPGEPVEITVDLDRKMPNDKYDVSLLRNAPLLNAQADVTLIGQTTETVTLRVVVEHGLAGAGAVFVICN